MFFVTTVHKQPILGKDACVLFDLFTINEGNICTISLDEQAKNIANEFNDLFEFPTASFL